MHIAGFLDAKGLVEEKLAVLATGRMGYVPVASDGAIAVGWQHVG
jgi:hypothetical protein